MRKVIKEFNERGLDSLRPSYRGGRPRRITDAQRERIVTVAGARPDTNGAALTRWSLRRLAAHLAEAEGVEVSPALLDRILAAANPSLQRTRSWKASPDPGYEAKAQRVIALCKRPPKGSAVIAFDQMGPISLRPTYGAGWAAKGRPERHRATFHRAISNLKAWILGTHRGVSKALRQNLADPFLGLLKGLPSGEEAREIRRLRPPAIGLVVVDCASARGDEKAELQPDCNRAG